MLTGKILALDAYVRKEEKLKTQWSTHPPEEGREKEPTEMKRNWKDSNKDKNRN